jgi:hypothetical protein
VAASFWFRAPAAQIWKILILLLPLAFLPVTILLLIAVAGLIAGHR